MVDVLIFSGHRIDDDAREAPRFPAGAEKAAARAIGNAIDAIKPRHGIASGANGGDILFHEACRGRGIATTVVLPFPPDEFVRRSVEGTFLGHWVRRFHDLIAPGNPLNRLVVLDTNADASPFRACNKALIGLAQSQSPKGEIVLLALWDGRGGDGPGGTGGMVRLMRAADRQVKIISPS